MPLSQSETPPAKKPRAPAKNTAAQLAALQAEFNTAKESHRLELHYVSRTHEAELASKYSEGFNAGYLKGLSDEAARAPKGQM